jgi:hypothetical protein
LFVVTCNRLQTLATNMVDTIIGSFMNNLQNVSWMDPVTKAAAVAKENLLAHRVGYPANPNTYSSVFRTCTCLCVHRSPHGDVGCRAGITTCCRVSIWRRFSASSPRRSRTLLRANWVVHPTVTHGPCSLIVCYDTLSAAVSPSAHVPRCILPAVNAYYDAPTNSLTIPAGILQYPCECSFCMVPYHDVDDGFHCC